MKAVIIGLILLATMNAQSSYAQPTETIKSATSNTLNNRKSSIFQNRNGIGWQTKM
jgi:hypothetical protein